MWSEQGESEDGREGSWPEASSAEERLARLFGTGDEELPFDLGLDDLEEMIDDDSNASLLQTVWNDNDRLRDLADHARCQAHKAITWAVAGWMCVATFAAAGVLAGLRVEQKFQNNRVQLTQLRRQVAIERQMSAQSGGGESPMLLQSKTAGDPAMQR